jgi:hypothetical protein
MTMTSWDSRRASRMFTPSLIPKVGLIARSDYGVSWRVIGGNGDRLVAMSGKAAVQVNVHDGLHRL